MNRAAHVAPFFDESRLALARRLAGMRRNELATSIGKSPAAIGAWELGSKRPTADSIAALALSLGVEPSFFLGGIPSGMRSGMAPHFRSLRNTSQIARDQAEAYSELVTDTSWALERHVEFPEVDFPDLKIEAGTSPQSVAIVVRKEWDLGVNPIRHVVRAIEKRGILVVFGPSNGTSSIDAFSVWNKSRPVIVLNPAKRDYYRQRFDAAHELGHLVMHSESEPGSRIVENQAHQFAAEFLMPAEILKDILPTTINANAWRTLKELKETWGVSVQALLMRARDLGTISETTYRNAVITVNKWGWRRAEPGAVSILEQPSLLASAVEQLIAAGMDERRLSGEGRTPLELFRQIVCRTPDADIIGERYEENNCVVVSLFNHSVFEDQSSEQPDTSVLDEFIDEFNFDEIENFG